MAGRQNGNGASEDRGPSSPRFVIIGAGMSAVWTTGCRSWYLDDRGIPAVWPWTFDRFREEMFGPALQDYDRN